jgi:hypothetical protein
MQFKTKNSKLISNKIHFNTNEITEIFHINFLGLEIDNLLSWNLHIDKVINKLTVICFMLRACHPHHLKLYTTHCFIRYYLMVLYFGGILQVPKDFLYYKKGY